MCAAGRTAPATTAAYARFDLREAGSTTRLYVHDLWLFV